MHTPQTARTEFRLEMAVSRRCIHRRLHGQSSCWRCLGAGASRILTAQTPLCQLCGCSPIATLYCLFFLWSISCSCEPEFPEPPGKLLTVQTTSVSSNQVRQLSDIIWSTCHQPIATLSVFCGPSVVAVSQSFPNHRVNY